RPEPVATHVGTFSDLDLPLFFHYIGGMHAIFIADAHLKNPADENYRLMLRFLQELPHGTDRLFILGDFFEFWLGDSPAPFPHYWPVLDALQALVDRGVELFFFEGNHDFHLGRYFTTAFNARVYPDSAELTMDGKRLFLCHGDLINSADHAYRILRFIFRNPLTRLLARIIPPSIPAWIAVKLGNHSKGKHKTTTVKWDYMQLVRDFAAIRFQSGYDVVVSAHFHRPLFEDNGPNTLLALGDWINQYSYAEWSDGTVELKTYHADSTCS
ncbi:MAG TPA: UDP-2,3-diacylglucosamine diphosphatase, partial [Geobacteraceae bacterium]|nr:UDP-2,3-diacylglucosamine diphosphatase [Geobacteraceae bacterium]